MFPPRASVHTIHGNDRIRYQTTEFLQGSTFEGASWGGHGIRAAERRPFQDIRSYRGWSDSLESCALRIDETIVAADAGQRMGGVRAVQSGLMQFASDNEHPGSTARRTSVWQRWSESS